MNISRKVIVGVGVVVCTFAAIAKEGVQQNKCAAFEPKNTHTVKHVGRTLDYYLHGSDPAWGAKNPKQRDNFAVMLPKGGPRKNAPLYVVLHSAGHALQSCLDCLKTPHNHDIYTPPADFYALFVDCRTNSNTDWWWGQAGKGLEETPVEKRIVATVKWTIEKYSIDPNRVYLSGNSMGGSGTLGIGLRHGDLFAAIKANVPAGVIHCSNRMGFVGAPTNAAERAAFDKAVSAIPDPPVLVDYSAPNDKWSKGHEDLFLALAKRRYAVLGFWGDFGHANKDPEIAKFNDIIHDFAWTNMVLNAAYPVFTGASCDSKIDFVFGVGSTRNPGQINGFFRWKNVSDSSEAVAIELRLVTPEELKSKFFTPPATAVADVAFRRLQKFAVKPGEKIKWTFGDKKGEITVGADGLLAVEKLVISAKPEVLTFYKEEIFDLALAR